MIKLFLWEFAAAVVAILVLEDTHRHQIRRRVEWLETGVESSSDRRHHFVRVVRLYRVTESDEAAQATLRIVLHGEPGALPTGDNLNRPTSIEPCRKPTAQ